MEVTTDNFEEVYPLFVAELKRCAFFAVDQEMTGVDLPESVPDFCSDSDEDDQEEANERSEGGNKHAKKSNNNNNNNTAAQQKGKQEEAAVYQEREDRYLADLDDDVERVYYLKRRSSSTYMAFQFGITLFTPITSDAPETQKREGEEDGEENFKTVERQVMLEKQMYEVRPFNFFLKRCDGLMVLSGSAIDFLATNHCNFQRWLTKGIFYERRSHVSAWKAGFQRRVELARHPLKRIEKGEEVLPTYSDLPGALRKSEDELVPLYMKEWVMHMEIALEKKEEEFFALACRHKLGGVDEAEQGPKNKEGEKGELPSASFFIGFRRASSGIKRLLLDLYHHHDKYKLKFVDERHNNNNNNNKEERRDPNRNHPRGTEVMVRVTPDYWAFLLQKAPSSASASVPELAAVREEWRVVMQHKDEEEMHRQLGFCPFWEAIVAARKPMVGHNYLHDLMFMYAMHEARLPKSYEVFKKRIHALFPAGIFDSKLLAMVVLRERSAFPQTKLEDVFTKSCLATELEAYKEETESGACPLFPGMVFAPGFEFEASTADDTQQEGATNVKEEKPHPPPQDAAAAIATKGVALLSQLHNAGFDAFVTGFVFRSLAKRASHRWLQTGKRHTFLSYYRNMVCGFGSAFFTHLTPSSVLEERRGEEEGGAGGLPVGDELVFPHSFVLYTSKLVSYMDVKDALFDELRRQGETSMHGYWDSLSVMGLHRTSMGCSRTFHVSCISPTLMKNLIQGLSKPGNTNNNKNDNNTTNTNTNRRYAVPGDPVRRRQAVKEGGDSVNEDTAGKKAAENSRLGAIRIIKAEV